MNEHQQKLWRNMIDSIQSYLNGETNDFFSIVGGLEGSLDASEIKDKCLVTQWYDLWTPLEIRRAIEGNAVNQERAKEELMAMREFLQKHIEDRSNR